MGTGARDANAHDPDLDFHAPRQSVSDGGNLDPMLSGGLPRPALEPSGREETERLHGRQRALSRGLHASPESAGLPGGVSILKERAPETERPRCYVGTPRGRRGPTLNYRGPQESRGCYDAIGDVAVGCGMLAVQHAAK